MEREEIEAMWERIKALEENQLKLSKALGSESVFSTITQMTALSVVGGKRDAFQAYMKTKFEEVGREISNAKNIDKVIHVVHKFNDDCIKFTGALFK